MELPFLRDLFIIFALCVGVIFICNRLRIPALVGFLITGVLCGPYGLGLISDIELVNMLAQIGIVLLLFSIGMELHLDMLIRLKKFVLIGGNAQALLTIAVSTIAILILGGTAAQGIFVGFLITLSSTAIVLQYFQQQSQVDSPQGHICLAILIYQDLIVVPMMLVIPILTGAHYEFNPMMLLIASGSLGLIVAGFLAARKLVPYMLAAVVRTGSRELFNISILALGLAIALLTASLGLSLALGAFLAGIILAESEYSQNAMEGVVPFKDIFSSLFFISVGMLLNTSFAFSHIWLVLALALVIILAKTLVTAGVTKLLGYPWRTTIIVGLALSQVGEFSFVLAKQGLDSKLITHDHYQLFLAASIVTMALAPFILNAAPEIARRLTLFFSPKTQPDDSHDANKDSLQDHLIIIGFGVGGKYLATAAKEAGIKYKILEMNPDTVRKYRALGEPIHYGDGTVPSILRSLQVKTAGAMAILISDQKAGRGIVRAAHQLNPKLHIVARSMFLEEAHLLKNMGASDVVAAEFETALEVFDRILSYYLVPQHEIARIEKDLRAKNYPRLRSAGNFSSALKNLEQHMHGVDVATFKLAAKSELCKQTLAQGNIHRKLGVSVIAIQRGDQMISTPGGDFRLECADVIYLFGPAEKISKAAPIFSGENLA